MCQKNYCLLEGETFMRETISGIVRAASWLAATVTVFATVWWVTIVADGNYCWSALGFTVLAIPPAGGMLLLGVIPSSVLYIQTRQRRDLTSLYLAGLSLAILIGEVVLINIIPMRGE